MGTYFKKKKEPIEKIQYFSYLNSIKNQYYKSIINNSNNNRIALQRKDFEKIRQIKLVSKDTLKIKDIDWFVYISRYFRKRYKEGFLWYKTIRDKISEEDYLYEIQYQNLAFYKDFELKFKSKCLKNIDNEKDLEMDEDEEEALVSIISKNTMIDLSRNSKMDLSGITDNYGGSFGESREDLELYEEDSGYRAKKKLKKFIKLLKKHLNMKDHPINIIISIYCKHFSLVLQNEVENFANNNKNFSDIIEDLKRFIMKIQTTTKLFYSKSINLDFFIEEKDELINLVTSIIFQKSDIYNNIYSLFTIQYQKEINDFKYKLLLVKDTKPIDLNIPDKLSLDENTTKEILKIKEKNKLKDDNDISEDSFDEKEEIEKKIITLADNIFSFIDEIDKNRISYMNFIFNDKELFIKIFINDFIKCENEELKKRIDEYLSINYEKNNENIKKYLEVILTVDIFNYLTENDKAGKYFHIISLMLKRNFDKKEIKETDNNESQLIIEPKYIKQSKDIIDLILNYIQK